MNLAWVRDEWRAVVGKEINVGFSQNSCDFLTNKGHLASHERFFLADRLGVPPVCRSARPNMLQGDSIDSSHLDTTAIFERGNELWV